jgi:alpha-tubulin suppressor-like RCC1 family protein
MHSFETARPWVSLGLAAAIAAFAACSSSSSPPGGGGASFDGGGGDATFDSGTADSPSAEDSTADTSADGAPDTAPAQDSSVPESAADAAAEAETSVHDAASDVARDTAPDAPQADASGEDGGDSGVTFGPVTAVSVGRDDACALTKAGQVVCFGSTEGGGFAVIAGLPATITSLSMGDDSACAVDGSGSVYCWGLGTSGQLGNGMMSSSPSAVQVQGLSAAATQVSVGSYFACAVLADTSVACWGDNSGGELGNDTTDATPTNSATPVAVAGLTGVSSVAAGNFTACAVTTGGSVYCWGGGLFGQLANMPTMGSPTPVQIPGVTAATSVAIGYTSACAVAGGGVQCWGTGLAGQLGNGSPTGSDVAPGPVTGLTSGVVSVTMTNETACALTAAGGVQCWGYNMFGMVGDGSTSNRDAPVQAAGLTSGVVSVSAGASATCAVVGCSVQCWGIDLANTALQSNVPAVVPPFAATTCM